MIWQPEPTGKRGRTPRFSDAAIQACLTLKVLFNLPLRQATGFVESPLNLLQLDYHQCSLVESKIHCVKRLGQSVMAREFSRQVAELHVRIGFLNVFSALGRPVTVAVA